MPALADVNLPGGAAIKEDAERAGRGRAYRANLPAGMQTKVGEHTRSRSYRNLGDGLGADRTAADAMTQLTAWLNSAYREGWVPRFEAPKPKVRRAPKNK